MSEELFDFGFSAVTEQELEVVTKATTDATEAQLETNKLQDKLDNLYNAILPLLTNLKANSEKDYIYWPNRVEKVKAFQGVLAKIYNEDI